MKKAMAILLEAVLALGLHRLRRQQEWGDQGPSGADQGKRLYRVVYRALFRPL